MDTDTSLTLMKNARELMENGYHCSEAMLLALGAHYMGEIHPQTICMSTPFAGGVGCSHADLCGALTGGIMLIGAMHGRVDAQTNDERCQALAAAFRAQFLQAFGWLKCQDLKDHWIGLSGQESCAALMEKAAGLLIEVLEST